MTLCLCLLFYYFLLQQLYFVSVIYVNLKSLYYMIINFSHLFVSFNNPFNILMSNENATPFRCAKIRPIKSCAQICYVHLYSTIKGMFLHNNFNSSDSANIRRNVSLQITLNHFWRIQKSQKFCTNVFCWSVDQLTFRHKFDCCNATLNTILSRNISLHKRRNGLD